MNTFESIAYTEGYRRVAGVDEAGRGPLAGPVVAAAVILPPFYLHPEINDSKALSPRSRDRLYEVISQDALAVGVGVVGAEVIDRINILQASLLAMRKAVLELSVSPDFLLLDGLNTIALETPQKTLVKGDARSISIAAASIVAKVTRDRWMRDLDGIWPGYGFAAHKGYGTAMHQASLARLGATPIHRHSYAPISAIDGRMCDG